ncbi:TetR family transcriptional regulator [Gordonia sp. HNM0687]|uniref:TetR family transcriptional regulator n=1 Tax=Gordonia mangrovi TaxID=2665643 RepID=A0A6L7GPR7_9ACTN|nr:TetR/AcrR family transcriptional regulator [Gordonia mangrovi]MDY6810234.1 TetR/AcrR family transcriptional regulator [Actinomycetota bacterium]MXP21347.1 TetR family transcriptional regulator [Gordonia mangrovi]UVF80097.1 TetR/AcrR family transcriptional regulator [Gordonia mangrovi]
MGSVTRTQAGQTMQRRAEVTDRVLGAVEDLLGTGERFTELPVQRIAQRSGMSRTNFYQYFPNKSQVLIQVADVASKEFFAAPTSWFADDASLDAGVAGVQRAIAEMIAEFRKHWPLMRALGEAAAYDAEVAEFWFGRIHEFIDFAAGRVQRWQTQGRVDDAVTTESVAAVTWMVERTITQHIIGSGADVSTDDQVVAALSRTIWLTIAAGAD